MKPIKYAQKDNRIFPYCDLNFSGFVNSGIHRKSIVNKIIVGSDSKFYVTDIYHYVMSKGFDTNNYDSAFLLGKFYSQVTKQNPKLFLMTQKFLLSAYRLRQLHR